MCLFASSAGRGRVSKEMVIIRDGREKEGGNKR
jgi:hypothetical protein